MHLKRNVPKKNKKKYGIFKTFFGKVWNLISIIFSQNPRDKFVLFFDGITTFGIREEGVVQ